MAAVNYDDKRFDQVESAKGHAMNELEQTYAGMIGSSDKYFQEQIDASQQWADKQSQIQQEQTDFTIQQVEQQKEQANKDYLKEQSGAYVDWQKQSDQYGVNAEKMASSGMTNTGYSETAHVNMYTAYQNRVAMARESYNLAVLNYNNAIKDAQLQNNAALAEIAYQALQTQLELSLEGFQYKNQLILDLSNKKLEVDQMYYQRYQDVLEQINTENAMAEQIRQFNLEYNEKVRQFNAEIARLKKKDAQEYAMEIQRLEMQKAQLEEQKRQFSEEITLKKAQMAEDKRQFDLSLDWEKSQAAQKAAVTGGGGNTPKVTGGKNDNSAKNANSNYDSAYTYISAMIRAGKNKNDVLSEIAIAQAKGALTKSEAAKLRAIFNPIGHQYT